MDLGIMSLVSQTLSKLFNVILAENNWMIMVGRYG